MTAEQLQAARAAHWRQNQRPFLTLDDAENWLEQHPLCLFLPRRGQLPAPAPSFVEACMGSAQATPSAAAIEQAQAMLSRLIAADKGVALNLLGAVTEQPDFVAHQQALPYVLCLRADADWKHAPQKSSGHKVSPLVLELWKALDKEGVLTAARAQEILGRELTEAAVLRALCELWQGLRISPAFAEPGQPARWELMRVRHRDALTTAGATSQVTALSLLVSMYLQSVYAASSEEIEIFLSPLASRSRVREAVRGLSATRQIQSLSMDAQTYYFLEDGLPEFAELAAGPPAKEEQPYTGQPTGAAKLERPNLERPNLERHRRPLPPTRPMPSHAQPARLVPRPAGPAAPLASPAPFARKGRPEPRVRTEWKGARPAAAPGRPSGQSSAPAAAKGRWPARDRGARPPHPAGRTLSPADRPGKFTSRPQRAEGGARGEARPGSSAPENRSSRGPVRPGSSAPENRSSRGPLRPGNGAPENRSSRGPLRPSGGAGKPDTRSAARPGTGAGEKRRPAPWARPSHAPGSSSRPPSGRPLGARPPGGGFGAGASGRTSGARPPRAGFAADASGRRESAFRPTQKPRPGSRAGAPRDLATGRASGPPPTANRPSAAGRPGGRPERGFRANSGPGGPARSARPGSNAGGRPPRSPGSARPRTGGYRRPAAHPGASGGETAARPAFAPGARPPRSSSRSSPRPGAPSGKTGFRPGGRPGGKSAGKPGKPPGNFRGSKPVRKKPGL